MYSDTGHTIVAVENEALGSKTGRKKHVSEVRATTSTLAGYQRQLLGGEPTFTAKDLAQAADATVEEFNDYWLAMGFQAADPNEPLFTEMDAEAFHDWVKLSRDAGLGSSAALSLIRAQSHLADRLSLWQMEALVEDTERRLGLDDTSARLVTIDEMENFIPVFEEQLLYSWRRQMEGLLQRVAHEVAHRPPDHSRRRFPLTRTLGFVDMVAYTSSSSGMGRRLVDFIEHFEYVSRTAVARAGGRVVKMIGDAVFFIADDLATGVSVATHLMDTLEETEDILPVRASLIQGDVFSRSGDVFGPPVNLASRLADIAPPGVILTDAPTAAAIEAGKASDNVWVTAYPQADLRGFGKVLPYAISWKHAKA